MKVVHVTAYLGKDKVISGIGLRTDGTKEDIDHAIKELLTEFITDYDLPESTIGKFNVIIE